MTDEFPLRLITRVTGWPRSSLYHEPRERADVAKLDTASQDLAGAWPTYGYRRITAMLRRDGCPEENGYAERLLGALTPVAQWSAYNWDRGLVNTSLVAGSI